MKKTILSGLILVALLAAAPSAMAVDFRWGQIGDGTWHDGTKWTNLPAAVPGIGDTARFDRNAGVATYAVTFTNDARSGLSFIYDKVTFNLTGYTNIIEGGGTTYTWIRYGGSLTVNGGTMIESNELNVANQAGLGALILTNGAQLFTYKTTQFNSVYIGANAGAVATALITGSGTKWVHGATAGHFIISQGGTGTLTIANGGRFESATANEIIVGRRGNGTIAISGGGVADLSGGSGLLKIGEAADSTSATGAVTVAGSGSELYMGARLFQLGNNIGAVLATGSVVISDGGKWTQTSQSTASYVGAGGSGRVEIYTGGEAVFGALNIANYGQGWVTVSGTGSKMTASVSSNGEFRVGVNSLSSGTLRVESNAVVTLGRNDMTLANSAGSTGRVVVAQGGILQTATDVGNNTMTIGKAGFGFLTIESGGSVTGRTIYLGNAANTSRGEVQITGMGSVLTAKGDFRIGALSTGIVTVADSGKVAAVNAFVGYTGGQLTGNGTVTVTGTGSLFSASSLGIGGAAWDPAGFDKGGTGTVNVVAGGRVDVTTQKLNVYSGSRLHLDGGTVTTSGTGISLLTNSTLSVALNAPDVWLDWKPMILQTAGTTQLQGNFFEVSLGSEYSGANEDVYTLLKYNALDGTDNRFFGYDEGSILTVGAEEFRLSYGTDLTGYVTLTVIPEPGTLSVLGMGMVAVLLRRRSRKI